MTVHFCRCGEKLDSYLIRMTLLLVSWTFQFSWVCRHDSLIERKLTRRGYILNVPALVRPGTLRKSEATYQSRGLRPIPEQDGQQRNFHGSGETET